VIGHLDCSTGVAGDKFLGALLDAGSTSGAFTAEHLADVAARIAPEARVSVSRVSSCGISALGVRVETAEEPPHRHWRDIRLLLEGVDLPDPVRETALRAFGELALAEAAAHGCAVDDVHFHEVGATDSLVDMVGVCAGLHALGIESLTASPVATGWGTVRTSHGVLPVPAPATAALLVGVPVVPGPAQPDGSEPGELTTPTGAALLRACATNFGVCPPLTPQLLGYGAGTRDIGTPNVCRILIGTPAAGSSAGLASEAVTVLEANIDHISPEAAAIAAEQLLAEGALDVWIAPIVMKKGRAAFALSVLVPAAAAENTAGRIVALTGTLGVRRTDSERFVAERESRELQTPYGSVRFKVGAGRVRAEADDVARIARDTGRAFAVVAEELAEFAAELLGI